MNNSGMENFLKLFWGFLINNVGSYFLLISLSIHTFMTTESTSFSSWPLVIHWVPGPFLFFFTSSIIDKFRTQRIISLSCFFSGFATLALLYFVKAMSWPFFLLLFLRSLGHNMTNSLKPVTMKTCIAEKERARFAPFVQVGGYLGMAISGVLALIFVKKFGIEKAIIFDAITFFASAIIFLTVKGNKKSNQPSEGKEKFYYSLVQPFKVIVGNTNLLEANIMLFLISVFLQGSYDFAINFLPQQKWNIGEQGVGILFVVMAMAVAIGATIYRNYTSKYMSDTLSLDHLPIILFTSTNYFLFTQIDNIYGAIPFFFFVIGFENLFIHHLMGLIKYCPEEEIAKVSMIQGSICKALMGGMVFILGYGSEILDVSICLNIANLCFLSLSLLAILVTVYRSFSTQKVLQNIERATRLNQI